MNKQIFSLLGSIGASPYMTGEKRLNSHYAEIETLYDRGSYAECVSACSALFEELMRALYVSVTGGEAPLAVILSDIDFWNKVDDKPFCDTAGMLQYACYRLNEEQENGADPAKAAKLAKSGLDDVIEHAARFFSEQAKEKCLDPVILMRDDVRGQILEWAESFRTQLDAAGCSDGVSMQPPFMNAALLNFPEGETKVWARCIGEQLRRAGLLTNAEVGTLDAEQVVEERVGMTNEFIRRAAASANGGVLLVEHFEAFDMPILGGNLLDRALKTIFAAAEKYRGSLCIVVSGQGENVEKAFQRAERGGVYFRLALALDRDK